MKRRKNGIPIHMKNQSNLREIMRALGRIGGVAGFGISVVTPLVMCILFAVWLKKRYGFGEWVIAAAVIVGLISAGCGAYRTIRGFLREEERRDAQKAAEYSPAVPRRDPNEVWHIPPETPGEQENPQKLE